MFWLLEIDLIESHWIRTESESAFGCLVQTVGKWPLALFKRNTLAQTCAHNLNGPKLWSPPIRWHQTVSAEMLSSGQNLQHAQVVLITGTSMWFYNDHPMLLQWLSNLLINYHNHWFDHANKLSTNHSDLPGNVLNLFGYICVYCGRLHMSLLNSGGHNKAKQLNKGLIIRSSLSEQSNQTTGIISWSSSVHNTSTTLVNQC